MDNLKYEKKSAWKLGEKNINELAEEYKKFMVNKSEYELVDEITAQLKKNGFKDISTTEKLNKNDKVFMINKDKSIIATKLSEPKLRIITSHLDSPRIEVKPNPLFESGGLVYMDTHYYGGIKKYQWANIPLEIHCFYYKKGKRISFTEKGFVLNDLLPHLAKKQMEKTADKVIEGDELDLVVGSRLEDNGNKEEKEKIKENILNILNKKYGIVEEDFNLMDIYIVPSFDAQDIGLDKSMIGAYGHDDTSSVFTSLKAFLDSNNKETTIFYAIDKEEIGSEGVTGAQSKFFEYFLQQLIKKSEWNLAIVELMHNGKVISGDVTAAFDPVFEGVYDKKNSCMIGYGAGVERSTGYGGKYSGSEAPLDYVSYIKELINDIPHQFGELGKVDQGGGGTVASYFANRGFDVIDIGVPVMGMHSPFEIISKADLYATYLIYKKFFEN